MYLYIIIKYDIREGIPKIVREQQLVQQLNGVKADSARAGEEEVGLRALEREAAAQRQLLETYLARYREAASRVDPNSTPADARVVSTAIEPVDAMRTVLAREWPGVRALAGTAQTMPLGRLGRRRRLRPGLPLVRHA